MATDVRDHPAENRYEVFVDDELAGFSVYRQRPGLIAFMHTEIDDAFAGRGLGSTLAKGALDDARTRELAVLPFCPFVNSWIKRHEEYVDLVPADRRAAFDL